MARPSVRKIEKRKKEALGLLRSLGLPDEQQNDRSALTLLALLSLGPSMTWEEAQAPLIGVTPIMEFIAEAYDKRYAPNSRETIRRFTLHQFVQAGLVLQNPDERRPTNSPNNVYQIEPSALTLLRSYETKEWKANLEAFLSHSTTLQARYAGDREQNKVSLLLPDGIVVKLSRGGQNEVVQQIIEEFCPRFTPGAKAVYIGDTAEKWAHFDRNLLSSLGVEIEEHGKIPDVLIYDQRRDWLVLIEAVTSHGPMNPKRVEELKVIFAGSTAGLVFVTAFGDRKTFIKYLRDIAWETEVWIADAPSHMIHFNGERAQPEA